LALRRFMVAPIMLLGAVVTSLLIGLRHQSPADIVQGLLYGTLSLAACMSLWLCARKYKSPRLEGGVV
jgi:hypothetical protein